MARGDVVARADELIEGRRFLAMAREPEQAALLIQGEPGIGKTSLLQGLVREAVDDGFRVLTARPAEVETSVAFAGLADLLEHTSDAEFAKLPPPQARALEVACLRTSTENPGQDLRAVATAVTGLFRLLSRDRPVLVAIDDVQWLDHSTSDALAFAARRLNGHATSWLLAQRIDSSGAPPIPLGLSELDLDQRIHLDVQPLNVAGVRAIVELHLPRELSLASAIRLRALSGGNPLVALELARSLPADGLTHSRAWTTATSTADSTGLMAKRLAALPASVRLALAAAAADPSSVALETVLGAASLRRSLATAVKAEVVVVDGRGRVRFTHPLLAASAYSGITDAQRGRLHVALAAATADMEERARHLLLAHSESDVDIASSVALGAQRAAARGSPAAAADLMLGALSLVPPQAVDLAHQLTIESGQFLSRAGNTPRALGLLQEHAARLPTGVQRAATLSLLGEVHLQLNDLTTASELLETAAAEAGDDYLLATMTLLRLSYTLVNVGRPRDAFAVTTRALATARAAKNPMLTAMATCTNRLTASLVGEPANLDELEPFLNPTGHYPGVPGLLRPDLIAGVVGLECGQLRRARTLLDGAVIDVREAGDDVSLTSVLQFRCWAALRAGHVIAARQDAVESLALAHDIGSDTLLAQGFCGMAQVALMAGDFDAASTYAEQSEVAYRRVRWSSGLRWPLEVLGRVAAARGLWDVAVRQLDALRQDCTSVGLADLGSFGGLPPLIEALVHLGRLDEASEVVEDLELFGRRLDRSWALGFAARGRADIYAAQGDLVQALGSLDSALKYLQRDDPYRFEISQALLLRGRIERRLKRRGASRESLQECRKLLLSMGADGWVPRVDEEIARLGGVSRPNGLSEIETIVARLAAQGMTNREVAEQVFVTPKSVEAILARAYAKLHIRSRAELGAWLVTLESSRDVR